MAEKGGRERLDGEAAVELLRQRLPDFGLQNAIGVSLIEWFAWGDEQ